MESHAPSRNDPRAYLVPAALAVFTWLFVYNSWQSDDAYITIRSIDNFLCGFGLRWNIAERVQPYTHPLWMLVLMGGRWLTGEYYFAIYLCSFVFSLWALVLGLRAFRDQPLSQLFLLVLLFSSKAFVDYTSSGLENPLSYLLLAAFYANLFKMCDDPAALTRGRLWGQTTLTALAYLTRPDSILLYALPLAWQYLRQRSLGMKKLASAALLGLAPAIVWSAFSLVYYGFLLPNTFYAKLGMGMPKEILLRQGWAYVLNSIAYDPITPVVILLGLAAAWLSRASFTRLAGLSLLIHLYYVVSIGGDFMSGRFFTLSFLGAALLTTRVVRAVPARCLAGGLALGLALVSPYSPLANYKMIYDPFPARGENARKPWDHEQHAGVSDERWIFFHGTSLMTMDRGRMDLKHPFASSGKEDRKLGGHARSSVAIGMRAMWAGPQVHYVDRPALADPLLARMPIPDQRKDSFRIGHFNRKLPAGYLESVEKDANLIEDPSIREFYEKLRVITRGPLFTKERWKYILQMNFTSQAKYKYPGT